jgi:hypothetical protein
MAIGKAIGYGTMLGGMSGGALIGGVSGGALDSNDRIGGTLKGAAIGTGVAAMTIGPFAGLETSLKAGKTLGKVGLTAGKEIASGVGKAALGSSDLLGKGLMKVAKNNPVGLIGAAVTTAAIGGILGDMDTNSDPKDTMSKGALLGLGAAAIPGAANAIAGLGVAGVGAGMTGIKALGSIGTSMVKKTAEGKFKLSATATPLLVGTMAVKGITQGIKTFEKRRMGTNDGRLVGPAPTIPMNQERTPSYANNAGATGDLVFSMFNNR